VSDNPRPQKNAPVRNIAWYLPLRYTQNLLFIFAQIEMFHNHDQQIQTGTAVDGRGSLRPGDVDGMAPRGGKTP
jgi:hypothetical protein